MEKEEHIDLLHIESAYDDGESKIEEDVNPKERKCDIYVEGQEDKNGGVALGVEKEDLQEFVRVDDDDGESKIEEDVNPKRRKFDNYVEGQEDKNGAVALVVEKKEIVRVDDDDGELEIEEDVNLKKCKCDNYVEGQVDKNGVVALGVEKKDLQEIVRVDNDDGELKIEEDVNPKKRKELDDYVEDKEGGIPLDSSSSYWLEKEEVDGGDSDSGEEEENLKWAMYFAWRKQEGSVWRELIDKDRGDAGEFTKMEVDSVELQPHEYQNLDVPEEELSYYEALGRYNYLTDKPLPFRPFTSEEQRLYDQQIEESEGFDVPFIPYAGGPGMQVRVLLTEEGAILIARYSKLALIYYNNRHGTDYAFERIEKANSHSSSVATYYITFVAKSGETFQARVHEKLKGDIDVLFCRIKPCQRSTA
ncbi:hypothetical protein LguiB_018994 [Lonicera macranthoides]